MNVINDLWNRVGLISKLAKEHANKTTQFGKTAIMKYLYILQEVFEVPCGYNFSLYTYGPYCSDVLSDLDYVEAIDGVKIYSCGSGSGGYNIEPSYKTEEYLRKSADFLEKYSTSISKVIELFGDMSARDLELRSTIIYIYKNYLKNNWSISNIEIASDVKELKPHFNLKEILSAYEQLERMSIFERITK